MVEYQDTNDLTVSQQLTDQAQQGHHQVTCPSPLMRILEQPAQVGFSVNTFCMIVMAVPTALCNLIRLKVSCQLTVILTSSFPNFHCSDNIIPWKHLLLSASYSFVRDFINWKHFQRLDIKTSQWVVCIKLIFHILTNKTCFPDPSLPPLNFTLK